MKKQIKSKKRVADHGEVFTAEREVNAMLDLVKQETERIDSRFLHPALSDCLRKYHKPEIIVENGKLIKCATLGETVDIPDGITAIADHAFICPKLRSLRIPDSVTELEGSPFNGCRELLHVHIPAHLLEGMTSLSVMWLFSDNVMNHPALESQFMERVLEGTDDYSDGFRDLFIRRLQHPFHAVAWIRKAICRGASQWVHQILELNDQLPAVDLESCIQLAAAESQSAIGTMLMNYAHSSILQDSTGSLKEL